MQIVVWHSTFRDDDIEGLTIMKSKLETTYKAAIELCRLINLGRKGRDHEGRKFIDHSATIAH